MSSISDGFGSQASTSYKSVGRRSDSMEAVRGVAFAARTEFARDPGAWGEVAVMVGGTHVRHSGGPRVTGSRPAEQAAAIEMAAELVDVVYAIELGPVGRFTYVSPSVTAMVGYTPEEHYADPELGMKLLDPRDVPILLASMSEPPGQPFSFAVRWIARDGRQVWTEHRCTRIIEPDGREMLFGAARDVTSQRLVEESLRQEREKYRLLAENSLDVVYSADVNRVITWVSPSVLPALGWQPEALLGRHVSEIVHPDDLAEAQRRQQAVIEAGVSSGQAEARIATADGDWRWMRVIGRVLYGDDGTPIGGIDALRDVQAEMDTRDELARAVAFDALTGLAKRSLALERIHEVLPTLHAPGWALLCLGVNGLTAVNQAYTYAAGDVVLKAVATRLVDEAGAHDRVARIAGDEFVIVMRDIVTPTDAANAAERILAAVRGPVALLDTTVEVTACIGIATPTGDDAEGLIRDATAAMRQAAAKGPDRWEFLDGNVGADTRAALAVQAGLREALAEGRVVPWFMPIAAFADGGLRGYEALVRWILPDGSVRMPLDFLDMAERTGLILVIDRMMLSRSLDAIALQPGALTVGVNVSAATLTSDSLLDWVGSELTRTGVDPTRLHLEVTETALIHVTDTVKETMRTLSDLGVSWWVDDFGTGFSSISHLRDLPIRGLKLDRTFTAGVTLEDDHAARLAQGLAGLAQGLGLSTIAEGVETVEQAQVLARQGWQTGQGWLFGRPAPMPIP
jgi:PAS domain S-box-containing protein/diguanylate cyclase (GGDEF)-like protein